MAATSRKMVKRGRRMIIEARRYFDVYLGFWVWSAVAA
jgi:hypothetical protein